MSSPIRIPPDFGSPSSAEGLPSFDALVTREPRGGSIDQTAVVTGAMNIPPLPGTVETTERERYRQKLIAANRALDGHVVNGVAKGSIEGVIFAGIAALGVAIFGGGRK